MHLEHHLVGGYVRYISPYIIIIIINRSFKAVPGTRISDQNLIPFFGSSYP